MNEVAKNNPPTINIGNRKWLVLSAVGFGVLLSSVDSSIVNIALPSMVGYFHTDLAMLEWVVLGYLLTVTTLMLSIGRLADMIGKKNLYSAGMIVFTIGSLLCGFASSVLH